MPIRKHVTINSAMLEWAEQLVSVVEVLAVEVCPWTTSSANSVTSSGEVLAVVVSVVEAAEPE